MMLSVPGTFFSGSVSGPVIFNLAEVGDWIIPEPSAITLAAPSLLGMSWRRRNRT